MGEYCRPWQMAMMITSTTCAFLPCRPGLTDDLAMTSVESDVKRPNIVVIMADDMGYGDVHALNAQSKIPTPHLDQLAADGMTFTDAHTPSAVCTPTRYGLLTGRYCWRSRLKRGVQDGYGPPLIETERATVASFLKSQGYHTSIVGKWHLGLGFQKPHGEKIDYSKPLTHGPNSLGFHESYIIPASLDFPPYVYIRNHKVTALPDQTQAAQKFPEFLRKGPIGADFDMEGCLDRLAEEASAFINAAAKKDSPFFLYVPLTAPHKPVWPHRRFHGKTDLGKYGDFVVQFDATVGNVLKSIDSAGVRDNTLLIYTSDNGSFMRRLHKNDARGHVDDETIQAYRADRHRANGPFRGTKADIWEAGHRVPFFARWPGEFRAGRRVGVTICVTDVFATVAEILNMPLPKGAAPDSFSFFQWRKRGLGLRARPPVVHHSAAGMFAIRVNEWKLVLGNGSGGRQLPRGNPFAKPYALFNLESDIAEGSNLILSEDPRLPKILEEYLEIIRTDEGYRSRRVFPGLLQ